MNEGYIKSALYNEIVDMYENEEFDFGALERIINLCFHLHFLYVHDLLIDRLKNKLNKENV